jgi:hypothetical protein
MKRFGSFRANYCWPSSVQPFFVPRTAGFTNILLCFTIQRVLQLLWKALPEHIHEIPFVLFQECWGPSNLNSQAITKPVLEVSQQHTVRMTMMCCLPGGKHVLRNSVTCIVIRLNILFKIRPRIELDNTVWISWYRRI